MEREQIREPVYEETFDCGYETFKGPRIHAINDILDSLNEAIKKGATHLHFSPQIWNDECDELEIEYLKVRTQTDEEFAESLSKEASTRKREAEKREHEERQQYEKLKAKYGNNDNQ